MLDAPLPRTSSGKPTNERKLSYCPFVDCLAGTVGDPVWSSLLAHSNTGRRSRRHGQSRRPFRNLASKHVLVRCHQGTPAEVLRLGAELANSRDVRHPPAASLAVGARVARRRPGRSS